MIKPYTFKDLSEKNWFFESTIKKDIISHDEFIKLACITFGKRIDEYFDSPLKQAEKYPVEKIVINNIFNLLLVTTIVKNSTDPLDFFQGTSKQEIISVLRTDLKDNTEFYKRATAQILAIKYILSDGNVRTKFAPEIQGKIPYSGLFSLRQSRGDEWFQAFHKLTIDTLYNNILHKTQDQEKSLLLLFYNIAFYLTDNYPHLFSPNPSLDLHAKVIWTIHELDSKADKKTGQQQIDLTPSIMIKF
jgi:hypothetical protein